MIKEALKQALVNIENSAKFTWETHEEDNSIVRYAHDLEKFCSFIEDKKIYPLGIGLNIPLTDYWSEREHKPIGFLYHDLQEDEEKWIHLSELCWSNMLGWFYDDKVVMKYLDKKIGEEE